MDGQLRMSMIVLENSQKLELSHNLYFSDSIWNKSFETKFTEKVN